MASENPKKIQFNVVVMESNNSLATFQYKNSITLYPRQKFGFHKYLNIGINLTTNPYICLCNNDLIFHNGWATEIMKSMKMIVHY